MSSRRTGRTGVRSNLAPTPHTRSSYITSVLADHPLGLWMLDESSGTSAVNQTGGSAGTLPGSGLTYGTAGPLSGTSAIAFDGTTGASVPVTLSGQTAATVEFWYLSEGTIGNDDLLAEYSSNANSAAGFMINGKDSGAPADSRFSFGLTQGDSTNYQSYGFDRPTQGEWHHYSITLDRVSKVSTCMIDGNLAFTKSLVTGTITGGFSASNTIYLMARNAASLLLPGRLWGFCAWDRILTQTERKSHATYLASANRQSIKVFSYTGSSATFVVPGGVNELKVSMAGAGGGVGYAGAAATSGVILEGTLAVTPGETLYFYVGGKGEESIVAAPAAGGFNGGGGSLHGGGVACGGGGGGGTDIRRGGTALANRIVSAAGGGGSGGNGAAGPGGNGGTTTGTAGTTQGSQTGGGGGTQSAGGAAGTGGANGVAGSLGVGGDGGNANRGGGGGGGGYYGGGGGGSSGSSGQAGGGGGGGSSLIPSGWTSTTATHRGHGWIIIAYPA